MDIPDNVREYIIELARKHNVKYVETDTDRLANMITRLSDDDVEMDDVELLLIALERAGVIGGEYVVPLHVKYLREKLNNRILNDIRQAINVTASIPASIPRKR